MYAASKKPQNPNIWNSQVTWPTPKISLQLDWKIQETGATSRNITRHAAKMVK
jgi:hypothetical protein